MKIALTGSTGFVGVHLIHHLLRSGHQVLAIKRSSSSLYEFELVQTYYELDPLIYDGLEWADCELFDSMTLHELFSGCDQVIHAAGFISYLAKDREKLESVNIGGTRDVVNACLSAGVRHLLFIGSIAANGKRTDDRAISEQDEWDLSLPHSYYGYTKHLAEMEVWRGKEEGLDVTVLRPGVILGYGNWNKSSLKLFRYAATSFPFYSNGITGYVGVLDLCRICLHFAENGGANDAFLVVSENRSYREISDLISQGLGTTPPKFGVKGWLYRLAIAVLWTRERLGLDGTLSLETARASQSVNRFSNDKLRAAIPFELESLEQLIGKACLAYKENSPPR